MSEAKILDGKECARVIKNAIKREVEDIVACDGIRPCLAVIKIGNDPASEVYVRNKKKAAEYCGIECRVIEIPSYAHADEVYDEIRDTALRDDVHGLIVQLPLPSHVDEVVTTECVLDKDADGCSFVNVSNLWLNRDGVKPCTPHGIVKLLNYNHIELAGKHAVIIGRSNIVGKPLAKMLLDENCTVTVAHSKTQNLKELCQTADILISAVGKPEMVKGDWVKKGAVVVDVGINRVNGKLVGDVAFDEVSKVASAITPVPGGVGPMTVAMLMYNTLHLFKESL